VDTLIVEIRALILSGDLKPGERLIEERLTEHFGVSRPPLREALRVLQQEGLIQSLPRRGSIVTPLDADDMREIYSLRWALEKLAIELGVPVSEPTRLQPLHDALARISKTAAAGDREGLLGANIDFHRALCGLAGHKRLLRIYDSLILQLRMYMAINLRAREELYGDPQDAVRRHKRLLDLIEAGDPEAVKAEIEVHGDRSFMDRLEQLAASEP
jgi:DNA-binding GntR family transcriptional regulator